VATTFRADIVTGLYTVIANYATAHPTLLVRAFRARPESFADLPCAWVETRNEAVVHDSGIRTRTMTPTVVVTDRLTNNAEVMARLDPLVDGLLDAFSAVPNLATGTIWSQVSIADTFEQIGDSIFQSVTFTFPNVTIQEGRS
jgi:hypothetical protein